MTLATSIALPVVRHPVTIAKTLSSLASLTQSRVIGGLGPGSSRADYDTVGVPFAQRWARFDEAMSLVRDLVRGDVTSGGRFYGSAGPLAPVREPAPEIWFGSWGSDRRLAALAGVADGWFASAYNATPAEYAAARARLDGHLAGADRDPSAFPDAIATAWALVTDDSSERARVLSDLLGPLLNRDPEALGHLPIGTPAQCAEALAAYAEAGASLVLLWPLRDARTQLERLMETRPS